MSNASNPSSNTSTRATTPANDDHNGRSNIEELPLRRLELLEIPLAQFRTTLSSNTMALTDFDTFKEDLSVYLHLQHAADQRWECLQRSVEYLTQHPLPPIHRRLLQASVS